MYLFLFSYHIISELLYEMLLRADDGKLAKEEPAHLVRLA